MTFKKKILIGYGIIFVLMGLVVAWAVTNLVMLGKASDAILKENYRSILAAENMVDSLERQDSAILLFFMGHIQQGIAQFRENEAVFLEWLARAKDNITISGETELVKALESDYTAYRHRFSELTDLRDRSKPLNGLSIYQETVYPLFIQVRKKCIDLRYLNEETMYKASIQAGTVSKQAIGSTVVVAVSALAVALVFCLVLANRIVRPPQHFIRGLYGPGSRGNRRRAGASGRRIQPDGRSDPPIPRDEHRADYFGKKQGRCHSFQHRGWIAGF